MWFKMGSSNIDGAVAEAPPPVQVANESMVSDTNLGGGQTLADGAPQRPVIDASQMITDVRAASGADQYIQPQIGSESAVNPGAVIGETVVLPGQQDPQVLPGDTMTREPVIGAAADGGIATVSTPGDHVDGAVDSSQTIKYEPIISTDTNGNLATDLKVGVPGNATGPVVPVSERKYKGRIPSGAKRTEEPTLNAATATASGGMEQDKMDQGLQEAVTEAEQSVTDGTAAQLEGAVTGVNDSENPGGTQGALTTEVGAESTDGNGGPAEIGTPPDMIGVGVPPPGEQYPNMQPPMPNIWTKPAGEPVTDPTPDAGVAIPAPRELTQEEKDLQPDPEDAAYTEQKMKEELGSPETPSAALEGAGDTANPNAADRIEPSNVAARTEPLSQEASDKLRADGVIQMNEQAEVIDATQQPAAEPESGEVADEVVPAVAEAAASENPEPVQDEVIDASTPTPEPAVAEGDTAATAEGQATTGATEGSTSEEAPAAVDVSDTAEAQPAEKEDSDITILAKGEDGIENTGETQGEETDTAIDASIEAQPATLTPTMERNQKIQERADEIAGLTIREAIKELASADSKDRDALINKVASAVVFKQLESEGIANVIDVKDPKAVWGRVSGMSALFRLWVREDQGYIPSDEKTVALDQQPEDTTQAGDEQAA